MRSGKQTMLCFEPDGQIAVGGLPVLKPELFGALGDFVVARGVPGLVETSVRSMCLLHEIEFLLAVKAEWPRS